MDAFELNIRDGFDEANGRYATSYSIPLMQYLPTHYSKFITTIIYRLSDRIGHIFFVKDMENAYEQLTTRPEEFQDTEKIKNTIELLDEKDEPLFVHLHWLGTHGPKLQPSQQMFSTGEL